MPGKLPIVAVSVGGGHDGSSLLQAYLTGLREGLGPPVHSYIVRGPLFPSEDRRIIDEMIDGLQHVTIVDFDPDFAAVVQAADAVVCMGGYNSIAESVYFGKRPIVAPRVPGSEEQLLRAEGFARLGLATVVGPEPLSASLLWESIDDELRRTSPPALTLDFDGLNQIALALSNNSSISRSAPGFGSRPLPRVKYSTSRTGGDSEFARSRCSWIKRTLTQD